MSDPIYLAYHIADYVLRKKIKHLIVHITHRCNYNCKHCFIRAGKTEDLSSEILIRLGNEIGSLFWLDIGGGEPFLRKDLADIISAFKARVIHIPTNGSLRNQIYEQVREIKQRQKAELVIGLSLDGFEETHDRIRRKGSWNSVWKCYEQLRQIDGVLIKFTTVINNMNFDELIPLMQKIQNQGADFHSVILLRGIPTNSEIRLPPLKELRSASTEIFKILNDYDYGRSFLSSYILKNFHRYLWNVSMETLENKMQVIPCLAGQSQAVIWPDGSVSACEMLDSVGDLNEKSFKATISSPSFLRQVDDIKKNKCFCTHNCALLDSIFFNPTNLPNLLYQKVRKV